VAALIVRAVQRIGEHALREDPWLWAIALGSGAAQWLSVNFVITLAAAGLVYALARRQQGRLAAVAGVVCLAGLALAAAGPWLAAAPSGSGGAPQGGAAPTPVGLFVSGLRAGLLTFGGAYTAIPFVQRDAVEVGGWMTNAQFLDGLALSGILPAPLIIFTTFVGYLGGGALGAILMTVGVFLPAFAMTLIGHEYLERVVENEATHAFLDGVTAGVVGVIGATALGILSETVTGQTAWVIFAVALLTLFRWKAQWAVAVVVIGAGLAGWVLYR
jgi:chromate transporter